MTTSSEYSRRYRQQHGGTTPSDKAQNRAAQAAVKWVRTTRPEMWRTFLAQARTELGLPTELGPGGTFTKPIDHGGTPTGGYNAHLSRGEPPCDVCRAAFNKYQQDRRAALNARSGAS